MRTTLFRRLIATSLVSLAVVGSPPVRVPLADLSTNAAGQVEWVVQSRPRRDRPTLSTLSHTISPEVSAQVYTALLNSHMEAVRLGWVSEDDGVGRYGWIESRLVNLLVYAPLPDWERAANDAEIRALRDTVTHQNVRIADLEAARSRLQAEVGRLRAQLGSQPAPPK